jgi:adenylate kinase family enzyme
MFYGVIQEGYIFDNKDIRYNVEEFEQGKVKTLFITGHSGSGKSTLGHKYEKKLNITCYELDDVIFNYGFSDDQLKEYGSEIYSFFTGPGKKYRIDEAPKREKNGNVIFPFDCLECIKDFIKFILSKNARCVVEGIYLYMLLYKKLLTADNFKNSAVIIKGVSASKSTYRALKRDYNEDKEKNKITFDYLKFRIIDMLKNENMIKDMRKKIDKLKEG